MMKRTAYSCLLAASLLLAGAAKAQLTGTITVPSTGYPDLVTTLSALNTQGVGVGGVVINLSANNPQTAPAGGYVLGSTALNATLSATNTITIHGNSNTITAPVGTGALDGIFKIKGADYVTIDHLNLSESTANTTDTTQMEWGYALLKLNNTLPYDGCNHVSINNCTISLGLVATSIGIYVANIVDTNATALSDTGATSSDAQGNNTFSYNKISNVVKGISLSGFPASALYDYNNTIVGNNITFGGGSVAAYGVQIVDDTVMTILNDTFATNAAQTANIFGINPGTGTGDLDIENNYFSLSGANTTTSVFSCYFSHKDTSATFTFNNNIITNYNFPNLINGSIYGLDNSGAAFRTMNILGNTISNITTPSTHTGGIYLLYNTSFSTPNINCNNNTITNITKGGTGGSEYLIYNYGSDTYGTINVLNNVVTNISNSANGSFTYLYGVYTAPSNAQTTSVKNNRIDSVTMTGTASFYGYYAAALNIVNASNGNGIFEQSNDTVRNVSITTGNLYGMISLSAKPLIHNNVIAALSATTGTIYGYSNSAGTPAIYNNLINGLQLSGASGSLYGINFTGGRDTCVIYNNIISDFSVSSSYSATNIFGINIPVAAAFKVYQNTIKIGATSTGANFGATGVVYASNTTMLDLRNNIINVNVIPVGTGFTAALLKTTGTAGVAPGNFSVNSGGNIYYAPNDTNSYLYAEGTVTPLVNAFNLTTDPNFNTACGLYKLFNTNDINAFTENNLSANPATYCYTPANTSYAKSDGVAIPAFAVTDEAGVGRAAPSDAGALQFTGTYAAAAAPVISFTALPATSYCTAAPTITATITDAGGVNSTTGTAPRVYYKKSTETNAFGSYPTDNNSSFNGWKYVEATGSGSAFSFTLDYSKLTAAVAVGDSISYFIVAQDNDATPVTGSNSVVYNTGFCPSGVNLTSSAGPVASVSNGYRIATSPIFSAIAVQDSICNGDATMISLNTPPSGLSIQWQQDNGTGTFSDITGATGSTYNTAALTQNDNFQAVLSCNSTPIDTATAVAVAVNTPALLSATGAYHCGVGTTTLTATSGPNSILLWFANASGGTPLDTGATFNTPLLDTTTTYFVAASQGTTTQTVGMPASEGVDGSSSAAAGVVFDAYVPFVLKSVNVYPVGTGSGTITIELLDAGNNVLQTITPTLTGTAAPGVATNVSLNFPVPAGNGLQLKMTAKTGSISGLEYDSYPSVVSFPYTLPNILSITAGSVANSYRYFYNWSVATDCETSRIPVTASIDLSGPAFNVTGTQTVCNNSVAKMNVTANTIGNYNSFVWAPTTNLYMDSNATIPYTGGSASTVYSKTTAFGSVSYLATATDTISQCTAVDSADISTLPSAATITGMPDTICDYGFVRLTISPDTGYTAGSLQWQSAADTSYTDITGAVNSSYASLPGSTSPYYRAVLKNSAGNICLSPADTVVIQDPAIASVTGATRCGAGVDTLSAIGSAGTTLYWYDSLNATTPVDTGNTFITPNLNATDTYYVSANNTGTLYAGKQTNDGAGYSSNSTGGLTFDTYVPLTIAGVYVYPQGYPNPNTSGTIVIQLLDHYGSVQQTVTATVYGGTAPATKTFVPLNIPVTVDTGYQLYISQLTNLSLALNTGITTPAYAIPNVISVKPNSSVYYYMYDWVLTTGCESAKTPVQAVIKPLPVFTVSPNPASVCSGDSITLSASSTNAGYTYNWASGNPNSDSITVAPTTSTAYTISVLDTNGCSRNDTLNVTVKALPVFTVSPDPASVCSGDSITLSASPTNAGYTYTWAPGNTPGNSITVAPTADTAYTISALDSNGCSINDTLNVTVNAAPIASIVRSNDTLSSANVYASYQWELNGQPISGATSQYYIVTQTGNYTLVVTNAAGCTDTSTVYNYLSVPNVSTVSVKVYPNPATDKVYISSTDKLDAVLSSIDGKVMIQQNDVKVLDMNSFADGVYILKLTDKNGVLVKTEKITKLAQ